MHQNALTCQYHEKQQSVLPTYEEVIRIGPSNQPPSAPLDGFLTPSAVVQVPLSNPPNYTRMPFPSTLYPYPPTNFPTPPVPPTNGDPQNGENPPTPTVAYKFPTAFKLTTLDKCYLCAIAGQLIFFFGCIIFVVAASVYYTVPILNKN